MDTNLIDKAFEPMIKFFADNELGTHYVGVPQELKDRWYEGGLDENETSINLRFDWELAEDANGDLDKVNDLMYDVAKNDLADLIENGEAINGTDAFLKAFNGERVRGQKAVDIQVIGALLHRQYNKKNKTYEYTMYFRPYVKWE